MPAARSNKSKTSRIGSERSAVEFLRPISWISTAGVMVASASADPSNPVTALRSMLL
jgi:hypothetical protein